MTGRDLIVYILQNNLEDTDVDSIMSSIFIDEEKVAKKFNVGVATVRTWYALGIIRGFEDHNKLYFPITIKDHRKE